MKAIIWGSSGQDGSHLSELLLSKGYEVIGVIRRTSNDSTGKLTQALKNPKFSIAEADVTDSFSVGQVLRANSDVDEIYNLAAQSHVAISFKQPAVTWDITGKGCINILQTIVDLNLLGVRFYQASSSEMFGSSYDTREWTEHSAFGSEHESFSEKYQDEDTKFMPQSPYAIAKCAAHYATRLFREGYGVHASAGILFNHEGERRGETFVTRKITKWIGDYQQWLDDHNDACEYNGDFTPIDPLDSHPDLICADYVESFPKLRLGNLESYRDWGYAGDYVEAMWMMLQQDTPDDYVICTGKTHTIKDFLDAAFKCINITDWSDLVVIDPEFYRPAEVDYLRGCNKKAVDVLGWKPKHSFEDLVKLMVQNDLHNETIQSPNGPVSSNSKTD